MAASVVTARVPGHISTVAGGVGGPAAATTVDLAQPCAVSYAAGQVYLADGYGYTVRDLNTQTGALTTPAGTALDGPVNLSGLATAASGVESCGAAADHSGNLVIAIRFRGPRIVVVAHTTGTFYGRAMTAGHVYSVAGTGDPGFSGDGGPATAAKLYFPEGVAVDGAGNVLIDDSANNRIRVIAETSGTFYGQVMTAGDIYSVAGNGTVGYSGDGGAGASAEINDAFGVAADSAGNLLIPDNGNNRIRVVSGTTGTYYGQAMTAGHIYTIAGTGISGYTGDGGPATSAELSDPRNVTMDGAGNVLISDTGNNRIRVIAQSTGTYYGQAMTAGNIYTVAGTGVSGYTGDGGPATSAELNPDSVTVDGTGNLVIGAYINGVVRVVAESTGTYYGQAMTAGDIYTVAGLPANPTDTYSQYSGDGGPSTSAELWAPQGLAVDSAGSMLIADTQNNRVRVTAARSGKFYGVKMTAGNIYTVAGDGSSAPITNFGGSATQTPLFAAAAVAVDSAGNLLISYGAADRLLLVPNATGTYYGKTMTAGHIYSIAGNGTQVFSGDGGPATLAGVTGLSAMTADHAGNLLLADDGRIRVVAAATGSYYGQAMTADHIYTIAGGATSGLGDGGPATKAHFCPAGVAVDSAGNVLISDGCDNRIRAVAAKTGTYYGQAMTRRDIYTIAGGATSGLGDGGPATAAQLSDPYGLAVDQAGNVLIADEYDNRIRVVPSTTGTYYGQAVTADDIYTVAGSGCCTGGQLGYAGFTGDGGPGTSAEINRPTAVAADGSGLVFADRLNNRIRMVNG